MAGPYNKEAITTREDIESGQTSKHEDDVAIKTETFAISRQALGDELPPNYWRSPGFIGTVAAVSSSRKSLSLGYGRSTTTSLWE